MAPSPKRLRTKLFGWKSLISCPIIIAVLVVFTTYLLVTLLLPWEGDYWIDDNGVDFVDYEERIDAQIARHRYIPKRHIVKDDPSHLLDIHNFSLIHTVRDPETFCKHSDGFKLLLVIIKSRNDHYASRELIRKTYGSLQKFRRWIIRLVFIIGANITSEEVQKEKLRHESDLYGDTIVGHLSENPQKVVYTHLMGYKWAVNHCRTSDFVLKAMDNMYIDMFQVIQTISHLHNTRDVMLCKKHPSQPVNRYYVSKEDFPEEKFPVHCSSQTIIMPFDLFEKVYFAAVKSPKVLWIEEVWTTGVLRETLGAVVLDIGHKFHFTFQKEIEWAVNGALHLNFGKRKKLPWVFLSLPRLDVVGEDLYSLWNHTLLVHSKPYEFELSSK